MLAPFPANAPAKEMLLTAKWVNQRARWALVEWGKERRGAGPFSRQCPAKGMSRMDAIILRGSRVVGVLAVREGGRRRRPWGAPSSASLLSEVL